MLVAQFADLALEHQPAIGVGIERLIARAILAQTPALALGQPIPAALRILQRHTGGCLHRIDAALVGFLERGILREGIVREPRLALGCGEQVAVGLRVLDDVRRDVTGQSRGHADRAHRSRQGIDAILDPHRIGAILAWNGESVRRLSIGIQERQHQRPPLYASGTRLRITGSRRSRSST